MPDVPDAPNVPDDPSTAAPRTESAHAHDAEAIRQATSVGIAYGLGAYLWWGLVPLYFKAVAHVPALEVLAHRVVWSVLLLLFLMQRRGKLTAAWALRHDRTVLLTLLGTTALIAVNWFTFIWAITNQRTLEAGLGYFINPLVNVMLGFVFLGERLRPWQVVSVALAAIGVGYRTYDIGTLPNVALILAFSFGLYGLLRKTARVEALVGLTVETTLLVPLAVAYLIFLGAADRMYFIDYSWPTTILLAMGGVITSVPLLWFTNAARRLRLATLGFLQYIAPSMQCLIAVAVFGEPFARTQWITFGLIWMALAIYSIDAYRAMARLRSLRVA